MILKLLTQPGWRPLLRCNGLLERCSRLRKTTQLGVGGRERVERYRITATGQLHCALRHGERRLSIAHVRLWRRREQPARLIQQEHVIGAEIDSASKELHCLPAIAGGRERFGEIARCGGVPRRERRSTMQVIETFTAPAGRTQRRTKCELRVIIIG